MKLALLFSLMCSLTQLSAQSFQYEGSSSPAGLTLKQQNASGIKANFEITDFQLTDQDVEGKMMKEIKIAKAFLPNNEGAPNVPGFSRYVALPQGATATLNVTSYRIETIQNVELAPSPRIPFDNEDGPMVYRKDEKIYENDAFYPANPFQLSEPTKLRGVDAVMLGITPFQYNPVSKELLVYRNVEMEVIFEGGNGHFGEDRLRSRWFDPILQDAFLNYQSLPALDYSQRIKSMNTRDEEYEYIIVVPNSPDWLPYAGQIKDWRTLQGIKTGIVTLAEIGGNTPTILENYFNDAFNNWSTPPVAVLLMADYGTDANTSITSPIWDGYCVSDNILADVNNNDMPDIIFARMTAQNTAHLEVMVSKMLDYESDPPTDYNFYHKPITALGWQTERWFQICSETVGGYWREVTDKEPVRINAIYSGTPGSSWSSNQNTSMVVDYFGPSGQGYIPLTPAELGGWSGGTADQVVNAINDGAFALQHRDHGMETGWGEPAFVSSHISNLTNNQDNELVFVFSINCLTGKYNMSGECFTEKFHRYTYNGQNAGALGLIAASEVSYSFVNDTYVWGMFDNFYPDFLPDYGAPVAERGFLPAFGNAAGKYFLQQSNWPYNTNNKEVTYNLFHHHGGAFMQVYSEVPQTQTVTHNPILYSGESVFTVVADAGSFIALTVNGEIIGTAESAGGANNIVIEPQLPPNTMIVTVIKQNYFRYEASVEIIPPSGPYVVGDSYVVNDAAGNNNGMMDYGESVMLTMTMKNVGVEVANNVTVTMTTSDPFVTITDGTESFGTIAANATVTVNNAFALEADENIPDGHMVTLELSSTNGTDVWESYISIAGHAPNLKFVEYIINDAGGNGNGLLDPGETAPMIVTVENNGSADAYDVMATLTSSDQYVSVLTLTPQEIGDLTPDNNGTATFMVTASSSVPAGYEAELNLGLTAGMGVSQQDVLSLLFPDYCYPSANCSYGDGFTGFSLEQISNMSNGCSNDGYGDFTDMIADLEAGQTYSVQWSTGYSNQQATLWIDLDDDKEFEASEKLITNFVMAAANQVYTSSFTIPAGDFSGNKRIRIRANWQNPSDDPCAGFSYGETEDYTANFGAAINYNAPQNMAATVVGNDVTLTWEAPLPMSEDVEGYNVYMDNQMVSPMVTQLTYTHNNCPDGSHWFSVSAVYPGGESGVAEPCHVEIGDLEGQIQGFVRDAVTNLTLNTAWVTALNTDFGAVSYETPFGSHYTLHIVGGTYNIQCNAEGYQPVTYNGIEVVDGATKTINFYLYPTDFGGEVPDMLTGINEGSFETLSMFPNPAKDEVNISASGTIENVKITNNMGQLVFDQMVNESTLKVNTHNFLQGVYFVEITTDKGISIDKLIIK
ncbi:MAG: T9SS type A sorting domain-containing protein [Bacteroidales bacterium]|nr:T9SS type A sorting domain-containing protein [Bacteroidales bacterium]